MLVTLFKAAKYQFFKTQIRLQNMAKISEYTNNPDFVTYYKHLKKEQLSEVETNPKAMLMVIESLTSQESLALNAMVKFQDINTCGNSLEKGTPYLKPA